MRVTASPPKPRSWSPPGLTHPTSPPLHPQLIKVNEPDLVLFVGEALVGNEAVDQLVKFNQSLADHSASDRPHTIDGIVLTKFDTIDDKVSGRIRCQVSDGMCLTVGTGERTRGG